MMRHRSARCSGTVVGLASVWAVVVMSGSNGAGGLAGVGQAGAAEVGALSGGVAVAGAAAGQLAGAAGAQVRVGGAHGVLHGYGPVGEHERDGSAGAGLGGLGVLGL